MATTHPGAKRAWIQTGGLAVEPLHRDLRDELDQVHAVTYLGAACFKLFDAEGRQVGIMQFQGPAQNRVDDAVAESLDRIARQAEKPADILAGDTVIRELDMSNPEHRDLASRAMIDPAAAVAFPAAERNDPPPIELPDYVADDVVTDAFRYEEGYSRHGGKYALLAVGILWAIIAAGFWFFGK